MKRRSRLLRIAKWSGVLVCVLIVAAWGLGTWRSFVHFGERCNIGLYPGLIGFWWNGRDYVQPPEDIGWSVLSNEKMVVVYTPRLFLEGNGQFTILLPLWLALSLVGAPTVFIWKLDRRPLPGHCLCGYDLTGNTSGACPECGVELQA